MSKADDGARPVLVGGQEVDAGITDYGITRASMLRPGQQVKFNSIWVKITDVELVDKKVRAHLGKYWPISFDLGEMVKVRDILQVYTDTEVL